MNLKTKLNFYKVFHLIRFSQEYLIKEYHPEDKMRCPIHFCLGQEALAACSSFFLHQNDFVLSHHRSHGHYFAKRCPINDFTNPPKMFYYCEQSAIDLRIFSVFVS